MRALLDILRSDDLPPETRTNFRAERQFYALWVLMAGAVDIHLNGVVAKMTFGASNALTMFIISIPVLSNILNVGWGVALRGRRRVRAMTAIICGVVICMGSIALTPSNWRPWGSYVLAGQLVATYVLWSALITLRSSLWEANYPSTHRARIAGRMQVLRLFATLLVPVSLGALYRWEPQAYRLVYPLAGVVGLLSLIPLSRIKVPDEDAEIAQTKAELAAHQGVGRRRGGFWRGVRDSLRILRDDVLYRNYMLAQFLLGSANFYTDPILLIVLLDRLELGYFWTPLIMTQIRALLMILCTPTWSRHFDCVGIFTFRVVNSGFWVAAYACVAAGMLVLWGWGTAAGPAVIAIIVLSRVFNGIAGGGGMLAWPLGHFSFARGHQANLYLGVHVALTGVRGMVMPQIANLTLMFVGLQAFVAAPVLAGAAHLLYRRLARFDRRPSDVA